MPIKLKKIDIVNGVNPPPNNYKLLGVDEIGTLVTKESNGVTTDLLPSQSITTFKSLTINNLTVGLRTILSGIGNNSIVQGINVQSTGDYTFAAGDTTSAIGNFSSARGRFVKSLKQYSYIHGKGFNNTYSMISDGINSFVHSYTDINKLTGTKSNYSAILGGKNHYINENSIYSVIIGGENNTISPSGSTTNIAVISCKNLNLTTTYTDSTVYVPRLTLIDSNTLANPINNTIAWNGSRFKGRKGSSWVDLDSGGYSVSAPSIGITAPINEDDSPYIFTITYPTLSFIKTTAGTGTVILSIEQNSAYRDFVTINSITTISRILLNPGNYRISVSGTINGIFSITGLYGDTSIENPVT